MPTDKAVTNLKRCLPLSEHNGYCWCDGPDTIGEHRAWCPDLILAKFEVFQAATSPLRAEAAPTPRCTCEAIFDGSEVPNWNIDPDCALHGRELPPAASSRLPAAPAPQEADRLHAIGDLLMKRGAVIHDFISARDREATYQVGMLLEQIARLVGNPCYAKWINRNEPQPDPARE